MIAICPCPKHQRYKSWPWIDRRQDPRPLSKGMTTRGHPKDLKPNQPWVSPVYDQCSPHPNLSLQQKLAPTSSTKLSESAVWASSGLQVPLILIWDQSRLVDAILITLGLSDWICFGCFYVVVSVVVSIERTGSPRRSAFSSHVSSGAAAQQNSMFPKEWVQNRFLFWNLIFLLARALYKNRLIPFYSFNTPWVE